MIVVVSFVLIQIREDEKQFDIMSDVSYISLVEDAELDEALKENNSVVEVLL